MAKFLVFAALLLAEVGLGPLPKAQAQSGTVKTSQVCLMKPGVGGAKIMLGESRVKAEQVLGPPSRKSKFYFEMDEQMATVYHYGASKLYFLKDRLVTFALTDGSLLVGQDRQHAFGFGSNANQFAAHYAFRPQTDPGKLNELAYHAAVVAYLSPNSDDRLVILLDKSDKVVQVSIERPC